MIAYVDAHQHVWRLDRGDYGWLTPALAPIYRDFSLHDVRPLAAAADIGATVLVQAAPSVAETRFLLEVARDSAGFVRGVVGWVDLAAPDAVARLEALAADPLLKGIRPMLHDLPDPQWILRADVALALQALPRLGLSFDALVKPRELPALRALLERQPELSLIVDHGAKPPIAAGGWQPWADDIAAIARHAGVHCKLSGLATEAAQGWHDNDLARYFDHLLASFGAERLVWGSDWPVVELAGGYGRWVTATSTLLQGVSTADRTAIRGGNARRFYRL